MAIRLSLTKVLTAVEADALTTHRTSAGTDHSDVVDGTTELAQSERVLVAGLAMDSVNELFTAIGGSAANEYVPLKVIVHLEDDNAGAGATGDMQITVGTSSGGTQILGATVTAAMVTLNDRFEIDVTGLTAAIAADSTLYVKVTTKDTTAVGYLADVYIEGQIFVSGT
jgi:hypothetical protein